MLEAVKDTPVLHNLTLGIWQPFSLSWRKIHGDASPTCLPFLRIGHYYSKLYFPLKHNSNFNLTSSHFGQENYFFIYFDKNLIFFQKTELLLNVILKWPLKWEVLNNVFCWEILHATLIVTEKIVVMIPIPMYLLVILDISLYFTVPNKRIQP